MALRTFTDPDGNAWNAWHVRPGGPGVGYAERYRDGWVCFERVGGGGRCRIPLDEMPPGWESLSEHRLDLLRRVAEASSANTAATRLPDDARRIAENAALLHRSGSSEVISSKRADDDSKGRPDPAL